VENESKKKHLAELKMQANALQEKGSMLKTDMSELASSLVNDLSSLLLFALMG